MPSQISMELWTVKPSRKI